VLYTHRAIEFLGEQIQGLPMTHPRHATRIRILLIAIISLSQSHTLRAQAAPAAAPPCQSILAAAHLVSQTAGWALVGERADAPGDSNLCIHNRLYWTDDDGQNWRDITPKEASITVVGEPLPFNDPRGSYTIFFLDRLHGWMIVDDMVEGGDSEGLVHFRLLRTEDAGATWHVQPLVRQMVSAQTGMLPTGMFFVDASHGWIFWRWATMNSRVNALTATFDGGRTWTTLPEPPGPGPASFISPRDGWMIGGSLGQQGVPATDNDQLWSTQDGGLHWTAITLNIPVPADPPATSGFTNLIFLGNGVGIVTADVYLSDNEIRHYVCLTHDDGKTWQLTNFEGPYGLPLLTGTRVIWAFLSTPNAPQTIRVDGISIQPKIPDELSLQGALSNLDFFDDAHAWATFSNGPGGPGLPAPPLELVSTSDSGRTFRRITPPAARDYSPIPPFIEDLNGSIIRFPPRPAFGLPTPRIPTNQRGFSYSSRAGDPMTISGSGFQRKNTVWIGPSKVEVPSVDGTNLIFLVPLDVQPGTYTVYVENENGKSNEGQVSIRPPGPPAIPAIRNLRTPLHAGEQSYISGSGFLIENTVWFGTQPVAAEYIISGGPMLKFKVPASLPPGVYEVHVSNAAGSSNIVRVTITPE
jgi:hypothetical protein